MRRWTVGVVLAIAVVAAAYAGTSRAHADRCHAERTCPSDDHSYEWSGMSCTSDPALRGPEDRLPIDHGGRRYWCHVVVDQDMVPKETPRIRCRGDRSALRTLTDPAAGAVRPAVTVTTVASLAALRPPRSFAVRASGAERTRYRVRGRLVSAALGAGSEIRLVLADLATGARIDVLFPAAACAGKAAVAHRRAMASARSALTGACGAVTRDRHVRLSGTATVSGVGFFARSPSAGNGFALAPALRFESRECRRSA